MKYSKALTISLKRFMNLHEYQASQLLKSYHLPTLRGGPARTPEEAQNLANSISGPVVIKAQVHAGGRGRGVFKNSKLQSGVHILDSPKGISDLAKKMLKDVLVTKQSGSEGKPVNTVFVVEKVDLKQEIYIGLIIDRKRALPLLIVSPKGGMGIEEIESKYILQEYAQTLDGFSEEQINRVVKFLQLTTKKQEQTIHELVIGLYRLIMEKDASLIEINPLGVLKNDDIVICDAKINIDDNAKPRQKELFDMEDLSQKDPKEVLAEKNDLNYVKLDGDIGCLVNGAGLAMATMDLINFKGGKPANFLDIGGTATSDRVKQAIGIINDDHDVKSIFINIFGGIVRCDLVAEGIIKAVKELKVEKPIVMRIKGNKSEVAKELIDKSGLKLFWFEDPREAAEKAISLS